MAKLTIDDKEYDTDDFTEKQMGVYNELLYLREQVNRQEYLYKVLQSREYYITQTLATSLSDDDNKEA